jgi:hypothetical protein
MPESYALGPLHACTAKGARLGCMKAGYRIPEAEILRLLSGDRMSL